MIGQKNTLSKISELVKNNSYPRFSIFVGKKGSGKKTLAKELSKMMGYQYVLWTNKIDDIRALTKLMWEQDKPTIYCIPDYEDMNFRGTSAILKLCEEPPNEAYIVLTSSLKEIILPTLLSRGITFELDSYSDEEMLNISEKYSNDREERERIVSICEVPGELELASNIDIKEFSQFVEVFWDKVGKSAAGNALKISGKLKTKEDQDGYDINLFINYLFKLNSKLDDIRMRSKIFDELIRAKKNIQLKYNKLYIVDNLILNIRSIRNGNI